MSEEKSENYVVDGFTFHDKQTAETATRECEGIKYIRQKTSMDNPDMVLQVYHKILDQRLFETPVGVGYLRELQEYLMTIPHIRNEDIRPIDTKEILPEAPGKQRREKKKEPKEENAAAGQEQPKLKKVRTRFRISMVFNVMLVLVVIGMFVISLTNENPNILNYENKLLNKYSSWEKDLNEREQIIKEKEHKLNQGTGETGNTGEPEGTGETQGTGETGDAGSGDVVNSVMGNQQTENGAGE